MHVRKGFRYLMVSLDCSVKSSVINKIANASQRAVPWAPQHKEIVFFTVALPNDTRKIQLITKLQYQFQLPCLLSLNKHRIKAHWHVRFTSAFSHSINLS